MRIELLYPYNTKWRKGYLVTNRECRKMVLLYNSNEDRTTTAYSRYLLSCHLGRFLNDDEQVDHINEDKTDDRLENLQILSRLENNHKTFKVGETIFAFICPVCNKQFTLTARQSHKENPTCSRRCGGIKAHRIKSSQR